jgi:lysozyme
MNLDRLKRSLIKAEGIRYSAYEDPLLGKAAMTTAIGHLIKLPEEEYRLKKVLSEKEVMEIFEKDLDIAITEAKKFIILEDHPDIVQEVIISLVFNMGLPRLMGFKRMRAALQDKDYIQASLELLDSKYARQLPTRSKKYAILLEEA